MQHGRESKKRVQERRFLVDRAPISKGSYSVYIIKSDEQNEIRIRKDQGTYLGMIKPGGNFTTHTEVALGEDQFVRLWSIARGRRLEMIRYPVDIGGVRGHINGYQAPINDICIADVRISPKRKAQRFVKPENWREITNAGGYDNVSLISKANEASDSFKRIKAANGEVITRIVSDWKRSRTGSSEVAVGYNSEVRAFYGHFVSSVNLLFPDSPIESVEGSSGTGPRYPMSATPGIESQQEKYKVNAGELRVALSEGVAIRVKEMRKQQDIYVPSESRPEGNQGEVFRIRRSWIYGKEDSVARIQGSERPVEEKEDYRVTFSYRPSYLDRKQKGSRSFSCEIDDRAAQLLMLPSDIVVLLKEREFYYSWNGVVFTLDSNVTRKDTESRPIHLNDFVEFKSPRNNEDRRRMRELKERIGLLRVDPITLDYDQMERP